MINNALKININGIIGIENNPVTGEEFNQKFIDWIYSNNWELAKSESNEYEYLPSKDMHISKTPIFRD